MKYVKHITSKIHTLSLLTLLAMFSSNALSTEVSCTVRNASPTKPVVTACTSPHVVVKPNAGAGYDFTAYNSSSTQPFATAWTIKDLKNGKATIKNDTVSFTGPGSWGYTGGTDLAAKERWMYATLKITRGKGIAVLKVNN